jgi:hypothetical protein
VSTDNPSTGVMLLHNESKSSAIWSADALTKHSSFVRYLIATVRQSVVK